LINLPRKWLVETTQEFEEQYAALVTPDGRLHELQEGWWWYLERNPVVMSTGLTDPGDDSCRVMTGSDPFRGVEYVLGVSLDRSTCRVLVLWLDTREFDADFG
jgi:hypothetical protein